MRAQVRRMQSVSARLSVKKPFSLFSTAISHGWYQTSPFRWQRGGDALERAERLHDGRVLKIWMREDTSSRRGHRDVVVTAEGEGARDPGVSAEMVRRCAVMLRLDQDLDEFYALCRRTPDLQKALKLGAGRCLRAPTLWEDVIKTILGTNVTWRQAVSMINRLAMLGDVCPADPTLHAWPTPGQVVRAGERFLRDTVRAGYRAPYILELGRLQKSGAVDLDTLDAAAKTMRSEELFKALLALKGVGKSSAHFLLSLLGHYDHISVDSATFAYATRLLFRGKRPTEAQIRRRFAKYGRWQALAYWFGHWDGQFEWWEHAQGRSGA